VRLSRKISWRFENPNWQNIENLRKFINNLDMYTVAADLEKIAKNWRFRMCTILSEVTHA